MKESFYTANIVDIGLIELERGAKSFNVFMPVHTTPVNLGDDLCVISRRPVGGPDEFTECLEKSSVTSIIRGTSIIHSTWMSGCGVVATPIGTTFALVGLNVAKHDETTAAAGPPSKIRKTSKLPVTRKEFDEAKMTVNSNIHGHGSYCLICEVARADGLLQMLT